MEQAIEHLKIESIRIQKKIVDYKNSLDSYRLQVEADEAMIELLETKQNELLSAIETLQERR